MPNSRCLVSSAFALHLAGRHAPHRARTLAADFVDRSRCRRSMPPAERSRSRDMRSMHGVFARQLHHRRDGVADRGAAPRRERPRLCAGRDEAGRRLLVVAWAPHQPQPAPAGGSAYSGARPRRASCRPWHIAPSDLIVMFSSPPATLPGLGSRRAPCRTSRRSPCTSRRISKTARPSARSFASAARGCARRRRTRAPR